MLNLSQLLISSEDEQKISEIFSDLKARHSHKKDPWGFNIELCEEALRLFLPLYRQYFKVRVFGAENVSDKPYLVVSNHTGQVPIDAMLITMAFLIDTHPPRILRAMVERFLAQLPFLGDLTAQTGSILGDRQNCQYLIDQGESILVFPEGVRGISKSTPYFYKLKNFSDGFYRIALMKKTPILPVCVIGAEEMYPFVLHSRRLASLIGVPALPITPHLVPLPSPIDIYIGKEISVELDHEATDKEIREKIIEIETVIKKMILTGLKNRRPFFNQLRKPLSKLFSLGIFSRLKR